MRTHPKNPLIRTVTGYGDPFTMPMRASDINAAFGFSKVPLDFEGSVEINGHRVWKTVGQGSYAKNRTWIACPCCGKVVSCGTLDQHMQTMHPVEG